MALKWMPKQKRARGRPKKNWMEGIRKAMNERNLNEGQWEDRKRWSLCVGQRRTTFWNRHTYIHTYTHTYIHTLALRLAVCWAWAKWRLISRNTELENISVLCQLRSATHMTSNVASSQTSALDNQMWKARYQHPKGTAPTPKRHGTNTPKVRYQHPKGTVPTPKKKTSSRKRTLFIFVRCHSPGLYQLYQLYQLYHAVIIIVPAEIHSLPDLKNCFLF